MSNITLRLTDEEREILNSVAHLYGGKLSTTIKTILFEKIEEDYNLKLIKDFEKREKEDKVELISLSDFRKELGVWMCKYKVYFDKKIKKDFKKLDKKVLKLLLDWIENNLESIENPRSKGKALVGNLKDYWRYRIGDYRLITKIDDGKLLIIALELKHRKEAYK